MYKLGNGVDLLTVGTAAGGLTRRLEQLGCTRRVESGVGVAMLALGFSLLWTAK